MSNNIVIIMAGGEGKRMESSTPKVLHLLKNKPMIIHILEKVIKLNPSYIYVIVGKHRNVIINTIEKYINSEKLIYIDQNPALGTGHAIMCTHDFVNNEPHINKPNYNILILSGDVPLISIDTMTEMLNTKYKVNILATHRENNFGYGRIIEDTSNKFIKIVEENDCNEEEKKIKKINCGVYSFNCEILYKYIDKITNNNSKLEYYLTDIFEIIKNNERLDINIVNLNPNKFIEVTGVNTKKQLDELEKELEK